MAKKVKRKAKAVVEDGQVKWFKSVDGVWIRCVYDGFSKAWICAKTVASKVPEDHGGTMEA
jgi:hypothetical protein